MAAGILAGIARPAVQKLGRGMSIRMPPLGSFGFRVLGGSGSLARRRA